MNDDIIDNNNNIVENKSQLYGDVRVDIYYDYEDEWSIVEEMQDEP